MRRLLGEERGEFSVAGVLMSSAILVVVLAATLQLFEGFSTSASALTGSTASQDAARSAADRLARDLRNLASPLSEQPQTIDVAGAHDLVFKTIDDATGDTGANVTRTKRVRYCVPSGGTTLVGQEQTWTTATPPAVPSTSSCPASGWPTTQVLASGIRNRADGNALQTFAYDQDTAAEISAVHLELDVDLDPLKAPASTRISTGVFLRNQNRRPTAAFTATRSAQGIVLNGTASVDPEGQPLRYLWSDGGVPVGEGPTRTISTTPGTVHTITLRVIDPSELDHTAPAQVVTA